METLREWRLKRVMSLRELATKAGVSHVTVVAIEQGRVRNVQYRTMRRLSEALGVEPQQVAEFAAVLEQEPS